VFFVPWYVEFVSGKPKIHIMRSGVTRRLS